MVEIALKGERCRDALAVIRDAFETIHGDFADLDVQAKAPMPDAPAVEEDHDYPVRLEKEEGPGYRHRPTNADRAYSVQELLDLVDRRAPPRQTDGVPVADPSPKPDWERRLGKFSVATTLIAPPLASLGQGLETQKRPEGS